MDSNCSENHSPVFFPLVCASFSSKNVCKKQAAMGRFADFIVRENKRFLLHVVQQQTAKSAAEFFAYILTGKRSANQQKKIQGCDFLLNRRPHAKIQLIWRKTKKQTKIRHRMVTLRRLQLQNTIDKPFAGQGHVTMSIIKIGVSTQWLPETEREG